MSRHEREQERLFTRRAVLITGAKLGLFGILGARLFQLQVLERDKYLTLAEENRVNMSLIAPERGVIYDRFDVPLAINVQDFRLLLTAERSPDLQAIIAKINRLIALSPDRVDRILRDIKRQHPFLPVLVQDNLTWDQMTAIEVSLPDLPGVFIEEGKIRSYPLNDATAHILGYVGIPNEKDLAADSSPVLSLPGFQIGKNGLEKQYDKNLRGVAGRADEEVNATGRKVRVLNQQEGIQGEALRLTLDAELQLFVQSRLSAERSACAVILDAYTGAVYAMASHPAFDPNVFSRGIPVNLWKELLADPSMPLSNKIISGQYPPGSTFKMMTGLAALHAGVSSEHRTVFCPGHMKLGDHYFHCWSKGGHGTMNMTQALAQSCDVYFYQMALDTGIDRISAMANRFSFGSQTGIDIPGERPGIMPTQAWKKQRYKQSWQMGDSLNSAIGQGYVLATPLQLAVMTARLVNGGIPITPHLAQKSGDQLLYDEVITSRMGVDPGHLAIIKQGMDAVVNSPRGTAHNIAAKDPEFAYGGKSGTAQVRRISMEERRRGFKIEDAPWEQQHHALFVGYAPLGNPRYVCAVVIEHGGGGSTVAAPIVRDILIETQRRMPEKQRQR
ncbi:MAG: mrdA [Alphaproteobacteria bacterium]|nr:mrdA [Alphaproteobacteria bacterium]